jgi:hypothetical protein
MTSTTGIPLILPEIKMNPLHLSTPRALHGLIDQISALPLDFRLPARGIFKGTTFPGPVQPGRIFLGYLYSLSKFHYITPETVLCEEVKN